MLWFFACRRKKKKERKSSQVRVWRREGNQRVIFLSTEIFYFDWFINLVISNKLCIEYVHYVFEMKVIKNKLLFQFKKLINQPSQKHCIKNNRILNLMPIKETGKFFSFFEFCFKETTKIFKKWLSNQFPIFFPTTEPDCWKFKPINLQRNCSFQIRKLVNWFKSNLA